MYLTPMQIVQNLRLLDLQSMEVTYTPTSSRPGDLPAQEGVGVFELIGMRTACGGWGSFEDSQGRKARISSDGIRPMAGFEWVEAWKWAAASALCPLPSVEALEERAEAALAALLPLIEALPDEAGDLKPWHDVYMKTCSEVFVYQVDTPFADGYCPFAWRSFMLLTGRQYPVSFMY